MYVTIEKADSKINLLFYENYMNLIYTLNVYEGLNSRYIYVVYNFSPDGDYFVYSFNGNIYFYYIKYTFDLLFNVNINNKIVNIYITENNDNFMIECKNDSFFIFDISLKKIVDQIVTYSDKTFLTFSKRSDIIAYDTYNYDSSNMSIILYNVFENKKIKELEMEEIVNSINFCEFSSDSKYFYWSIYQDYIYSYSNKIFHIYDLSTNEIITPNIDMKNVEIAYFIPNTHTIVFKNKNNKILFYDIDGCTFTEFIYYKKTLQILLTDYNKLAFIGIDFIDFFDLSEKKFIYSINYLNDTKYLFFRSNSIWYESEYLLK